jgi:uncharacterized membrane protein
MASCFMNSVNHVAVPFCSVQATVLKQHILQFSGYVWTENKEKERARVKDKLERYTKEGLVLLIDVLDLHLPRTGKKVKFLFGLNCVPAAIPGCDEMVAR